MRRFLLLLRSEVRLFRTALPIHLVAVFQPVIFFLLMTAILVHPTFDVHVVRPTTPEGRALVAAMREVGSPIGLPYVDPILLSAEEARDPGLRQVIEIESRNGTPTAVQRFGLVDSNQVKNLRNRLTAAALVMWDDALGGRAVTVVERPWLPEDVPYAVYYGVGMLPMVAFMAAVFIGGILSAQDVEFGTITEYRLAPTSPALILGARLARLVLTGMLSAGVLLLVAGWRTGYWPSSPWRVALVILPVALTGGGLGIAAGLLLRRSIPTLLVGLVASLGSWILGRGLPPRRDGGLVPPDRRGTGPLRRDAGGMFNIFLLTYREQVAHITLEFGLAPRSLGWVLLPKVLLALAMGLLTGTALLGVLYLWVGVWPGRYLAAVWLLMGLVTLFWIVFALILGLRVRHYMAGAVAGILGGAIIFFIGGGMAPVRYYAEQVLWIAWLFPNTHAIDPIRDLVLFGIWPADWGMRLLKLGGFALAALAGGMTFVARRMRRLG